MAKDTTYLKKIDEIVKQAAIEETFSLDVLNQIQALRASRGNNAPRGYTSALARLSLAGEGAWN